MIPLMYQSKTRGLFLEYFHRCFLLIRLWNILVSLAAIRGEFYAGYGQLWPFPALQSLLTLSQVYMISYMDYTIFERIKYH